MITHISISNYALIENLDLSVQSGLNTITGETGAGKSIILGAIGLCLGNRADSSALSNKDKKCVVEITLSIKGRALEDFFEQNDIDYLDETIIRREISHTGRSRSFVNDTPVNLKVLNFLGSHLIDIHSQKDTLLLNSVDYQLSLVDMLAGNQYKRQTYAKTFTEYQNQKRTLKNFLSNNSSTEDLDYLKFLEEELSSSSLKEGEVEQLEKEIAVLESAEDIQNALSEADKLLNSDALSISSLLAELKQHLKSIADIKESYTELFSRLESSQIELDDIASEISQEASSVEVNPMKLAESQERYNHLQHLLQKHHVDTISELLEKQKVFSRQIFEIENRSSELEKLEQGLKKAEESTLQAGKELSKSRQKVIPKLESEVNVLCKLLNFSSPDFQFNLKSNQEILASGIDKIELLFSSNKGHEVKPLVKAASGGELSRVMLALKSILAKSKGLATIIFDEIDTGVSGDTASKVAQILKEMSGNLQVIAITHLPQIAAAGNQNYKVQKRDNKEKTITEIVRLNQEEKVSAIAEMLSSANPTKAALDNARDLIAVS